MQFVAIAATTYTLQYFITLYFYMQTVKPYLTQLF